MIPKTHRLTLSSTKPFIGMKRYGKWCTIVTAPAEALKWSVTVSKKIDNRAVVRNKLRRQISQWLYRQRSDLKPQQFLIIPRRKPTNDEELNLLFEEIKKRVFKFEM